MNISLKAFQEQGIKTSYATAVSACIVVGVYEGGKPDHAAHCLDGEGAITAAIESGDISGKPGSMLLLHRPAGVAARRVLLLGLGAEGQFSDKRFTDLIAHCLRTLATLGADDAIIALPMDAVAGCDVAWAIARIAQEVIQQKYRADGLKRDKPVVAKGLDKLTLAATPNEVNRTALAQGVAIGKGMLLTRELGDMPPNICTPTYLADSAKALSKEYGFKLEILDRKALRALGMGSYLAIAGGSEQPPAFIVLQHLGGKSKEAPVVLVGKGLTFDSGGISIKPAAAMDEMKYDMCGAASVLGAFKAMGELNLKLNVVGIVAACENMPSGSATRPGDVVTSMSGLSIEVLNTDAEGRLVLCDALTYAERFKPAAVIDIATLTGACVVALGHHNSGLFTRADAEHDRLARELLDAGSEAGDRAWRMPLEDGYGDQLKSNFADLANIGTPGGGAIVAAAFLERFTRQYPWAHLDIAGTAWKSGENKGATGRPVPLLMRFLCNRAQARKR